MGYYRRLISDAFRRYNRKTSPVEKCASRNSFSSTCDSRRSGISQLIFRKSDLLYMANNNHKRSPHFVATRFYSADFNKVAMGNRHWYKNPRNSVTLGFLGGAVMITVYYWNSETVPYANRGTFVLLPTSREKKMGESQLKLNYKGKILGSDHPESIRVAKIGKNIIEALRKKLDDEKTAHLKEFNWEIVVVDDPTTIKPKCLSGGKIVVPTGLLNYLTTDAEIAITVGREVGRAVARHSAESFSACVLLAMSSFLMSGFHRRPWDVAKFTGATPIICYALCHCFMLIFCSWQETEAHKIGVLISASAGYDPRIAPEVYMKLGDHSRPLWEYRSYPDGKKRAQQLAEPEVMDEALSIYKEALNDNDKDPNFFKEKEKEGQLIPQQSPI